MHKLLLALICLTSHAYSMEKAVPMQKESTKENPPSSELFQLLSDGTKDQADLLAAIDSLPLTAQCAVVSHLKKAFKHETVITSTHIIGLRANGRRALPGGKPSCPSALSIIVLYDKVIII